MTSASASGGGRHHHGTRIHRPGTALLPPYPDHTDRALSFYTTELPEYMLVELVRGLNADVVAAALTYTLLVLLATVLAKGRATGREAVVRMLLTGGIMVAPQLGTGAGILLLSPDHVGSNVPVLLIWLLLDRAPRRWWVPVLAGALMTWALIGDGIVMYTGFLPLTIVCAIRACSPN